MDTGVNVSCCHITGVAETGSDLGFNPKSSACLLPKERLIEKYINLTCTEDHLPFFFRVPPC